jgi:hypothetical protein
MIIVNFVINLKPTIMKGIDKYIFAFLLIASLVMIVASCKQSSNEEVLQPNSTTETEKTYTSEGTISTGTKDTMNDHTNGIDNSKMDNTAGEVPVKGEVPPAKN